MNNDEAMSIYNIEMGMAISEARANMPEGYELVLTVEYGGYMGVKLIDDLGGVHLGPTFSMGDCVAIDDISKLTAKAVELDKAAKPINYPDEKFSN